MQPLLSVTYDDDEVVVVVVVGLGTGRRLRPQRGEFFFRVFIFPRSFLPCFRARVRV